ncbi:hypothetical protein GPECTOR_38g262 [Gonium pectorale]|uniref:DUF4536 domain-containing protein n=1 Tax=Gonium pectorale TaxID=33097 RepID=A0A150GBV6_GONPE|nr:hypothetical protein GPECTOR_38g262 [Gonium pectorale]|eukprot:KXZ47025.1 hypothetical protein GPECTOR_38g262 [Gonium pectorale]
MSGAGPEGSSSSSGTTGLPPAASPSGRAPAAGSGRAGAQAVPEQDCLGCRVTGCLFGLGGAAYLGSTLVLSDKPPRGAHRYSVIAAAGTMFVFGMYRAFA